MTDHDALQRQLFALYDGELTGSARQEMEDHLAGCPACRERYTQWQRTARALFRVPDVHASEAFVHRLMARLDAWQRPQRAVPRLAAIRWLAPAVALAGLLLLMIGWPPESVSVETLLLADGQARGPIQFVLASEPPTTDQVFGIITEGQP